MAAANHAYTVGVHYMAQGALNMRESAVTAPVGVAEFNMRLALMSNLSTIGPWDTANVTNLAINVIHMGTAEVSTISEYTGTGYAPGPTGTGRVSLASQTVVGVFTGAAGVAKCRTGFSAANVTMTALGATTGPGQTGCKGLVLFLQPSAPATPTEATNIPVFWIDTATGTNFPFQGSGGNVTFTWNAIGIAIGGDYTRMITT